MPEGIYSNEIIMEQSAMWESASILHREERERAREGDRDVDVFRADL